MQIPSSQSIRLQEIRYKPSDLTNGIGFGLNAIQLVFTNGYETPMFETQDSENNQYPV